MASKTRIAIRLWQAGRKTGADVLATLGSRPSKAELAELAEAMGIDVPDDATKADIQEAIRG